MQTAHMEHMQKLRWAGHGNDWPEGHRPCMKCLVMKPISEFHKHKMCKGGFNSVCKECRKPLSSKNYKGFSTIYKLWYRAKRRASVRGLEFSIETSDIELPSVCPVFHTPFEDNTPFAASLDRIDSSKGYTKENIQVLSTRANTLKNDATLAELELLVVYLRKGVCEII